MIQASQRILATQHLEAAEVEDAGRAAAAIGKAFGKPTKTVPLGKDGAGEVIWSGRGYKIRVALIPGQPMLVAVTLAGKTVKAIGETWKKIYAELDREITKIVGNTNTSKTMEFMEKYSKLKG